MTKHTPAVIEPERGALAELEKDYIAEAEEQLERKMEPPDGTAATERLSGGYRSIICIACASGSRTMKLRWKPKTGSAN